MVDSLWAADFAARLMHNEGFRLAMYRDSMGIPTIGCGFNLQRSDAKDALLECGVPSYTIADVMTGESSLTVAEVGRLLVYSDTPIIPQARSTLSATHFDNMSDARRAAYCDLDFNLGQAGLEKFATFISLVDQACHFMQTGSPDQGHTLFGEAADDLLGTAYAQQVGARAKRNAEMIRSSNYVSLDAFE